MRIVFVFIGWLLCGMALKAQTVTGKIIGDQETPVANATISLLKAKDSSLIKTAVSNATGEFKITHTSDVPSLLSVSAVGYAQQYAPVNGNSVTIKLNRTVKQLAAATVTARKPVLEIKPDKLVFNVEGSINATGSNALELLQKSPGVIVDKDDNIILSGKNGVRIYIDGKPSPLAGADLASYLKGMNSTDIEAIEIITNPSAKYDAEGNAGIINIRLKKNRNFGWNGNVNAGYGIGIFSKYNGGGSLNYRNKRINFFSNYSTYNNINENQLNLYRVQADTTYDQRSLMRIHPKGHNLKTGLDIFINKKSTIGVLLNGNLGDFEWRNNSRTPIAPQDFKQVDRILIAKGHSSNDRKNLSSNINYKYSDTSGRELNVDADYGLYRLRNNNVTPNIYVSADESQVLSTYTFSTNAPTDIDLVSIKADYEQNLWKGKISGGFKSSRVKTDNNFSFFNHDANDVPVYDPQRSNRFVFTEWINAVYGQYRGQAKKISYQVGLRLEQTNSEGDLTSENNVSDKNVKRNYLDIFPSGGITWPMNKNNTWGLSYSRRIDRPRYQDLNPFENKLDELTYQKGNPFLKPQYTNIIELRHTYKYKLTTTLAYSDVRDFFAQLTDTTEGRRSFLQQRNLANQKIISMNVSYPFNVTKWWSVYMNMNLYHTRYRATFEEGKTIKLNATVGSLYQQQTFQLGKGWTGELSGFVSSPSIWGGTYKTDWIGGLDAGVQKKFWKDNASIKATVSDIFFTQPWSGESHFGGLFIKASGQYESRQLKLNFTYRFGNKQVKSARNRNTGLDDLNQRVN